MQSASADSNKEIINRYDTICVEDRHLAGMMKNHHLARSIGGTGWSKFLEFLRYKAVVKGGCVLKSDRFAPSSK